MPNPGFAQGSSGGHGVSSGGWRGGPARGGPQYARNTPTPQRTGWSSIQRPAGPYGHVQSRYPSRPVHQDFRMEQTPPVSASAPEHGIRDVGTEADRHHVYHAANAAAESRGRNVCPGAFCRGYEGLASEFYGARDGYVTIPCDASSIRQYCKFDKNAPFSLGEEGAIFFLDPNTGFFTEVEHTKSPWRMKGSPWESVAAWDRITFPRLCFGCFDKMQHRRIFCNPPFDTRPPQSVTDTSAPQ